MLAYWRRKACPQATEVVETAVGDGSDDNGGRCVERNGVKKSGMRFGIAGWNIFRWSDCRKGRQVASNRIYLHVESHSLFLLFDIHQKIGRCDYGFQVQTFPAVKPVKVRIVCSASTCLYASS